MKPRQDLAWSDLGFNLSGDLAHRNDLPMVYAVLREGPDGKINWSKIRWVVSSYGKMPRPAPGANYYTASLFEGLTIDVNKCGQGFILRPDLNIARLNSGANHFGWPEITEHFMMEGIRRISNRASELGLVPPPNTGARVYLRPVYMQTGEGMGLMNLEREFTVSVIALPVGGYFSSGLQGNNVVMSNLDIRAYPGGHGHVKFAGNYARHIHLLRLAKAAGFDEILYRDAAQHLFLQELGAANVFVIDRQGVVYTPELCDKTILPGVRRACVIDLARHLGCEVREQPILGANLSFSEALFFTGTAAGIQPCASVTTVESIKAMSRGNGINPRHHFGHNGGLHPVVVEIYDAYQRLITGEDDPFGWTVQVTS